MVERKNQDKATVIYKGMTNIEVKVPYYFEAEDNIDYSEKEEIKATISKRLMCKWNVRLVHIPFAKLKLLHF